MTNRSVPPVTLPVVAPVSASSIIRRLEEAGATLLTLPSQYRFTSQDAVVMMLRTMLYDSGWEEPRLRLPLPDQASVASMHAAFCWIKFIPEDRYTLRRIVGAHSLIHPITHRHLYSYTRLTGMFGTDRRSLQRWHAQGIEFITTQLSKQATVLDTAAP